MQNHNSEKWGFSGDLLSFIRVKALSIFSVFLLFGCATSMQDLVAQAQLTDDWSLVNKRYDSIERLEAQGPKSCPLGMKPFCVNETGKSCRCMTIAQINGRLRMMGL